MLYFLDEAEVPKGSNKGPWVDVFNQFLDLDAVPWCGTSAGWFSFKGLVKYPRIKSARAKDYAQFGNTHSLREIEFGNYVPKCGDYRVKTRRGGHHVDVFLLWNQQQKTGWVIGGNVGDKVSIRKISLKSMIADGTTHITEVHGFHNYQLEENEFSRWLRRFGAQFNIKSRYEGIASYYGERFHGRQTASGETYDMTQLTAAHKSLKFGTMVRVTNKSNNKQVTVRINDRGPFVRGRIIDLSKAAADSIGLKLGKVVMDVL